MIGPARAIKWKSVVNKVERHLEGWQTKVISRGGDCYCFDQYFQ